MNMAISTLLFVLLAASGQTGPTSDEPQLKCETGPAMRRYGGNDWTVYACDDGRSVVILAGPSNPASPFYFIVRPDGERIAVYGEGTGDKRVTEHVYEELKQMTASNLADLYRQAVAVE